MNTIGELLNLFQSFSIVRKFQNLHGSHQHSLKPPYEIMKSSRQHISIILRFHPPTDKDNRLVQKGHVVTEDFFNERIKDWVKHYNYSLNPEGTYDAIKWMYTYGPDPHNLTHIREEYVSVSMNMDVC